MSEPRHRTPAEIADHASDVVREANEWSESARRAIGISDPVTALTRTLQVANLVERLAAQVEDLAAVVATLTSAPARQPGVDPEGGCDNPGCETCYVQPDTVGSSTSQPGR